MIQIDMDLLQLDPQVKSNLEAATERVRQLPTLEQKYRFIKSKNDLWRSTLGYLARLTDNTEDDCKCWYCECDGGEGFYFQVDHFRPKQRVKNKGAKKDEYEPGYWWLAFNPINYRVACQKCNTGSGKIDQFPRADDSIRAVVEGGERKEKPLLLDPIVSTDPRLLTFTQDGNIHPASHCNEAETKRVDVSIKVYNLRARSKREGRRKIWDECKKNILIAVEAYDKRKESYFLSPDKKESNISDYTNACARINKMTRRNAKFSSTAKSCIKEYHKIERARCQSENLNFDLDWLLDLM